jgi:hypothetical protein
MLPGKVFLESIKAEADRGVGNKPVYKLNLVLNDIYYDELKQYHTKYLCVNANDVLTLELYTIESNQVLGVASIADVYKHMLDSRTVDLKVKTKDINEGDLTIKVNFQTVSAYRRRSPGKPKAEDTKRLDESFARSPPKEKEKDPAPQAEMSFSYNRHPFNETLGNTSRSSMLGTAKLQLEDDLVK